MTKNILLLFGGKSTEHEISCVSAANFAENFGDKYRLYKIGITREGAWYLYEGDICKMRDKSWQDDTQNLRAAIISPSANHHGIMILDDNTYKFIHIDVAFPILHGRNGEDGTIQGLLTIAGIPFVGCDTYSSAVCMDKITTKLLCEREGIPTAPFIFARKNDDFDLILKTEQTFDYPVFVKPANSGSSIGVSKANNRAELEKGIELAFTLDKKILIEKAIVGREIEVAVMGDKTLVVSPCGEIDTNNAVYDYQTKYVTDAATFHVPARIDDDASQLIRERAAKVYKTLDCAGLSRVDFFLTPSGEVILNEINTIPGFTQISLYPRLMKLIGFDMAALIDSFILSAEERE